MMENGWHFICRPARNGIKGWVAFAKREPFTADAHPINEPGDLYFEFGATEAKAMANIRADVGLMVH